MAVTLALVCTAAVWLDLRSRRLPNWLTVGALVVALLGRALTADQAVLPGLASAAIALAFGLPFFLVGGLGGGDVKLMAGLAAFLSPEDLPLALLAMAFTGAAVALVTAARRGLLAPTLANVHVLVLTFGKHSFRGWKNGPPAAGSTERVSNPYAPAIVAGALAGWFL